MTTLVRMCGSWFAVTRRGRKLDIRQLPKPKRSGAPGPAQLVLPFPTRRGRG